MVDWVATLALALTGIVSSDDTERCDPVARLECRAGQWCC